MLDPDPDQMNKDPQPCWKLQGERSDLSVPDDRSKTTGERSELSVSDDRSNTTGVKSDLSIPDDRSIEDTVHAEDGGLGRVDYRRSEQGAEHSTVAAKA